MLVLLTLDTETHKISYRLLFQPKVRLGAVPGLSLYPYARDLRGENTIQYGKQRQIPRTFNWRVEAEKARNRPG